MNASLDEFRGYVLSFANSKQVPILSMEHTLEAARGHARLFRTVDSAIRFVDRHICQHVRTRVSVSIELSGSSLL